jgi:hypothetical protein
MSNSKNTDTGKLGRMRYIQRLLPTLLAFVLAFGGVAAVQYAFAEEEPAAEVYIVDVAIAKKDVAEYYAYASNPAATQPLFLTARGESLELDTNIWWNDNSENRNSEHVTWEIEEQYQSIVNFNSGVLTALADGMAVLKAKVDPAYTNGNVEMEAAILISVSGQTTNPYVSGLWICDASGVFQSSIVLNESLSTALYQFYAYVEVYDPNTGTASYHITKGDMSAVPGIGNLTWYMQDATYGSIDTTGLYRPKEYANVGVGVYSDSGAYGRVFAQLASIITNNPSGTVQDGHPQAALTVIAEYEELPGTVAIQKEYSYWDLVALGTQLQTVTAINSQIEYATLTGRGVYLSRVLEDAGINLAGIKSVYFDAVNPPLNSGLTRSALFDVPQYYYPNYDLNGSTAGAVRVYPMLAFESNFRRNQTGVDLNMNGESRFLLMLGSYPHKYQVKWVHTLKVTLSGGPSVQQGNDETPPPPPEEKKEVDIPDYSTRHGGAGEGSSGVGVGTGAADSGEGSGSGSQTGTERGDSQDDGQGANDAGAEGSSGNESGSGASNVWNIHQTMNPNDSDTNIVFADNPLSPFVLPFGFGVVAAGGTESALWFRRQNRPLDVAGEDGGEQGGETENEDAK